METYFISPKELPIRLTWTRDHLRGENPSEEYIAGMWSRDGADVLLRIRFYDCRQKREHISIYEVREGPHTGEEVLILEKPAAFSYPPAGSAILRQLAGIIEFPPALRLQWAAREGLSDVAAAAIEDGANPNEPDRQDELPLDAVAIASLIMAAELLESFRPFAMHDGGDEEAFVQCLASLADLHAIRSLLLRSGARDHWPFRQMVRTGDFEGAQAEFDKGVRIDAVTPTGTTLLTERILHRDAPAAAWLLEHGADPDWGVQRKLPQQLAHDYPHLNVEDSPMLVIDPFSAACIAGFPEGIDLLVKAGSKFGHPEVVKAYDIFGKPFFPDWVNSTLLSGCLLVGPEFRAGGSSADSSANLVFLTLGNPLLQHATEVVLIGRSLPTTGQHTLQDEGNISACYTDRTFCGDGGGAVHAFLHQEEQCQHDQRHMMVPG